MTPRPLILMLLLLSLTLALPAGAIDFPDPEDIESAERAKELEDPEGLPESVERDLEEIQRIDDHVAEKVEKINADAAKHAEKWKQWAARYDKNLEQMEWASKKSEEAIAKINEMRDKLVERTRQSVQRRRDHHVKRAVATLRTEAARKPEDDLSATQWKAKADELEETLSWDAKPGKEYRVPFDRFVKIPLPKGVKYKLWVNKEDRWGKRLPNTVDWRGHASYRWQGVVTVVSKDANWGYKKTKYGTERFRKNDRLFVDDGRIIEGEGYLFLIRNGKHYEQFYDRKDQGTIRVKVELIRNDPRSRRRVR